VQNILPVVQCPSTPDKNRIQDKPETTPPNKTGSCGDYFATAGVNIEINNSLPADQQFPTTGYDLRGVLRWEEETNLHNRIKAITDGTSHSIMLAECGGREDVWRRGVKSEVNYAAGIRARGGAWATSDNAYEIGQRKANDKSTIPGTVSINNSNEWGHCFYSFHPGIANFTFADGSVRTINESIDLRALADMVTRNGQDIEKIE
jgi:prepilin-type processing-associated H-X9-DG protein